MTFYQQKDIKLLMFPETSTYLTPLNGTIVVANPATYPWYSQINLLPDGADVDLPIRKREKRWGVGSGKHPSHIINTVNEPIEISLEMEMQDARFIALATGATTSAGNTQKEVQVITVDTYSDYVDGDQFLVYGMLTTGHVVCYQVYMDVTGDDSGAPSAITGATAVRIDFVTGDGSNNATTTSITSQATLVAEIDAMLTTLAAFTACDNTGSTVTYNTVAFAGAVPKPRDHSSNTGVTTFSTTTNGSSTHTTVEGTGSALPSFGLHFEVNNSTEFIAVDLFGCTVTNEEITIDYEEKTIREAVTIRCPFFIVGIISTIPPPKNDIPPNLWQQVVETTGVYAIMKFDGATTYTDMTPTSVSTITISIENEVEIYPAVGIAYRKNVIAGKRNVTMQIVGLSENKDLYTVWATDTWDSVNSRYTTFAEQLTTELRVQRTATYDLWQISIYNWLIESFALKVFSPEEAVMGVDITFTGATPNSSLRLIDSLVISDYIAKIYYNAANA